MLVLRRREGETIWIGDDICITIAAVNRSGVKLTFEAPMEVSIQRGELRERLARAAAPAPAKAALSADPAIEASGTSFS